MGSLQTGPEDPDQYYMQESHPLHPKAFGPDSIRYQVSGGWTYIVRLGCYGVLPASIRGGAGGGR